MAKKNIGRYVFGMKCRCLPKKDKKSYKNILKLIEEVKKEQ